MSNKKIKVVVIGGGNGTALVIDALKKYHDKYDLSAVVAVSDSGGSSGRLRREFKTLPPGDILRVVLASSQYNYEDLRRIFYQIRFTNCGNLSGHNLGNLFLTLGTNYCGDFVKTIAALSQSVGALAAVYPSALAEHNLMAKLDNDKVVRGEDKIDNPGYNRAWKIKKVWITPAVRAYAPALWVIKRADYIIFAPGSLYTSVTAALLPVGVKNALKKSQARFIYIGAAYRTNGETGPEYFSEFLNQLEKYLPRPVDLALYDKFKFTPARKRYYRQKAWACPEFDKNNIKGRKIIVADYESSPGGVFTPKLGQLLKKIIV